MLFGRDTVTIAHVFLKSATIRNRYRCSLPPTISAFPHIVQSEDFAEKESIIVVAGSRTEPLRAALKLFTHGSLLLVSVPLPLAVLVDDLLEYHWYLQGVGVTSCFVQHEPVHVGLISLSFEDRHGCLA